MKNSLSTKQHTSRTVVPLAEPVAEKLNAYALAAAAAGVTVLACVMPAEASPVCKSIAGEILKTNTFPFSPAGQAIAAFNIAQTTSSYFFATTGVYYTQFWNRGFFTPNSAGAKFLLGPKSLPANVSSGASIGPGGQFGKGAANYYGLLFTYGNGNESFRAHGTSQKHRGNLQFGGDNFVGYQFSESDGTHYGWLRLRLSVVQNPEPPRNQAKFTAIHAVDYGYESAPNTAIAAGSCGSEAEKTPAQDPASNLGNPSLGALTLGSEGLTTWKKPGF